MGPFADATVSYSTKASLLLVWRSFKLYQAAMHVESHFASLGQISERRWASDSCGEGTDGIQETRCEKST